MVGFEIIYHFINPSDARLHNSPQRQWFAHIPHRIHDVSYAQTLLEVVVQLRKIFRRYGIFPNLEELYPNLDNDLDETQTNKKNAEELGRT